MFGLTKREQRWAAEQKAAEVLIPAIVEITIARLAMDTNDRIAALERDLAAAKRERESDVAICIDKFKTGGAA